MLFLVSVPSAPGPSPAVKQDRAWCRAERLTDTDAHSSSLTGDECVFMCLFDFVAIMSLQACMCVPVCGFVCVPVCIYMTMPGVCIYAHVNV